MASFSASSSRDVAQENKTVNAASIKKYPAFFKVYIPRFSAHQMKIPVAFIRTMDIPIPDKIIIRKGTEKFWDVGVSQICGEVFFHNGWPKFIKDNHLVFGDFLVFRYNGAHLFDVEIFGCDGCEKKLSFVNQEQEEEQYEEQEGEGEEEEEEEEEENEDEEEEEDDEEKDTSDSDYVEEQVKASEKDNQCEKTNAYSIRRHC